MNREEQISIVKSAVSWYLTENNHLLPYNIIDDSNILEHVRHIATSIMCTKWDVGYPGGSFVQSVVKNDLYGSFANADSTNRQCIYFYVVMMHNISMPRELWNTEKVTNI